MKAVYLGLPIVLLIGGCSFPTQAVKAVTAAIETTGKVVETTGKVIVAGSQAAGKAAGLAETALKTPGVGEIAAGAVKP